MRSYEMRRFITGTIILTSCALHSQTVQAIPTMTVGSNTSSQNRDWHQVLPGETPTTEANTLRNEQSHRASDLQKTPGLWNWTSPLANTQIGQAGEPPATTPSQDSTIAADERDLLDEVSVTATRRPARQRDTTVTTYSVNKADIQAQGASNVTDALQLIPGFTGQPSLGGVRNAGGFFLRGFDDQRFLVLQDGLSLKRSSNNRSDFDIFSVAEIERIEVVNGGATLRYGSGAVGGVINLITETPKGPPKLTLSYEGGSYGFSRYVAKYGGGDDTFSYDLVYTGLVAFNNYPYRFTLPNNAQFYGPTTNGLSTPPAFVDPSSYPNGSNSLGVGGVPGDPANSGAVDLFGLLKPDVGPPITVSGTADSSFVGRDNYFAKLTFKPDPSNRVTLRLGQENFRRTSDAAGEYYYGACFGGSNPPGVTNGTLNGNRFLPVDANGNELPCNPQRYVVNTPSVNIGLNQIYGTFFAPYNTSANGKVVFPTGRPYGIAEPATGTSVSFERGNQSETQAAIFWDYDLTPTTSLNSYAYYYRYTGATYDPSPFLINTSIAGGISAFQISPPSQPYFEGNKLELQSALNTRLSAGQTLAFGVNFVQDRTYQQRQGGSIFFDRAISRTSVFLIDDISFSEQLKANIGFRYTYSTQFGSVGTPAVGLRYNVANFLSFRANGSYVFNAPSLSDLLVQGGAFLANPNLRPEAGVTYDVGVDFTPVQNIGLQLTYFNTYLDGAIGTATFVQDGRLRFQQQNLNTRIGAGIEALANWQIDDQFRLRVSWTNVDARFTGSTDSVNQSTYPFLFQYQDPAIPFNTVVAAVTYANRGFSATLLGRYDGGKRRALNGNFGTAQGGGDFIPDYATLDLNVEVPISSYFTLTGSVFNLTDTQYEYISGVPAPGTTFRVGGRLEFGGT